MSNQSFHQPAKDEISLMNIIDGLIESWKTISLGVIVGVLMSVGWASIAQPQFQGTANIQVAMVGGVNVEPPITVLEKLKMPLFFSDASFTACDVMSEIDPGTEMIKNLKSSLSKNSPIITISFKNESNVVVKKCLESVFNDIVVNQNSLADPILQEKKNQLIALNKKLDDAEDASTKFPVTQLNANSSNEMLERAMFSLTVIARQNQINDLRTHISDLENKLGKLQTRETLLLTPIFIPKEKASPSYARILIGGMIGGLFLGLLFTVAKRNWLAHYTSG